MLIYLLYDVRQCKESDAEFKDVIQKKQTYSINALAGIPMLLIPCKQEYISIKVSRMLAYNLLFIFVLF